MMPTIQQIAADLRATPADIPGLWGVPGYPELTTNQLVTIWVDSMQPLGQPFERVWDDNVARLWHA